MTPGADDAGPLSTRVLVLAPTQKDGQVTRSLLERAGLTALLCADVRHLSREVRVGAGAALVTEEAVTADGVQELLDALSSQPAWSELPVVVLMRGGVEASSAALRVLRSLANVTLLERPAPMRSVVSAVQVAVRGRLRQYQIRDQIEEIRRGEAVARDSEERYRRLVELSPDAVFVSTDDRIVFVNPAAVRLFSATSEEQLLGRSPSTLTLPGPSSTTMRPTSVNAHPVEEKWVRLDGTLIDVEATTVTIPWQNRPAFQVILRDIGQRTRARRERETLLESERAARAEAERAGRMKDEFLATLSHELRTPLNAIMGWATVLRQVGADDPAELANGLEVIERNARVQAQLIEDLLDMSRIISGKIRLDVCTVDLATVLNQAVESVRLGADAKEIRIERPTEPCAPIAGDAGRLQQIFWNLLSNAVKFTPRGGRVAIDCRRAGDLVEVRVTDSGQGIKPQFLPHVFERFRQADASTTRRFGGLGLGLAIVKHLTELHGGTVEAYSAGEGRGATFSVRLPLNLTRRPAAEPQDAARPVRAAAAAPPESEPGNLTGIRVLVVDDDADARYLVRRMLSDCDADVVVASSAVEALNVLATGPLPDVVVSDIGMPEMDGYEFIRRVRTQPGVERLPAVALTAFARPEDRHRALTSGYQSHIAKPVEPSELIAAVATLGGRATAPPTARATLD